MTLTLFISCVSFLRVMHCLLMLGNTEVMEGEEGRTNTLCRYFGSSGYVNTKFFPKCMPGYETL